MFKIVNNLIALSAIGVLLLFGACKEKLPVEMKDDLANLDAKTIQLDSNLVAYWSFDDNTATDMTGHGFNGNPINSFVFPAEALTIVRILNLLGPRIPPKNFKNLGVIFFCSFLCEWFEG